ncbi:hypothetical protein [Acetohalobium arabaticum]|uniref:Uncharacterized protein n=1 Tax=Acetohalobium arabaticum (strain ATCC 49924 / DSM 5501 / Z-7288) TaxID=574087 RepID=D9QSE8_ACEAZ|nr:hypothetical protein [Acetohalobium arabaticum]ADL13411.1 hypothetical protein Acear_1908 [Acetohalobium arabaticum DSM 5501]
MLTKIFNKLSSIKIKLMSLILIILLIALNIGIGCFTFFVLTDIKEHIYQEKKKQGELLDIEIPSFMVACFYGSYP